MNNLASAPSTTSTNSTSTTRRGTSGSRIAGIVLALFLNSLWYESVTCLVAPGSLLAVLGVRGHDSSSIVVVVSS